MQPPGTVSFSFVIVILVTKGQGGPQHGTVDSTHTHPFRVAGRVDGTRLNEKKKGFIRQQEFQGFSTLARFSPRFRVGAISAWYTRETLRMFSLLIAFPSSCTLPGVQTVLGIVAACAG